MKTDNALYDWISFVLSEQEKQKNYGREQITRSGVENFIDRLDIVPAGYIYHPTIIFQGQTYSVKTYAFTETDTFNKFFYDGQIFLYDIGSYKHLMPENNKHKFWGFIKFVEIPFELVPK